MSLMLYINVKETQQKPYCGRRNKYKKEQSFIIKLVPFILINKLPPMFSCSFRASGLLAVQVLLALFQLALCLSLFVRMMMHYKTLHTVENQFVNHHVSKLCKKSL